MQTINTLQDETPTGFGAVQGVVQDFLRRTGDQFFGELKEALISASSVSAVTLTNALVSACFAEVNSMISSGGPPPPFFDLKITDNQAEALDAIVRSDAFWGNEGQEKSRALHKLQRVLRINMPPNRENLRNSIVRREEQKGAQNVPKN
eukprot:Phypoly_transcript_28357.p1 GENE.Phypoly_transcript_28357~~Phypoly_transcript_28357.p1  ORF type:complete len:149 (+),score=37.57 Phypoly_transcript_28357:1-447(+)